MAVEQRIPTQGPDEWSDDARKMFAFGEGPEAYDKGSAYKIMLTFAHHPKLMFAWYKFNARLLRGGKLSPRIRELVILRVAWRYRSEYEWVQHVIEGEACGVGRDDVEAIKIGPDAPNWSDIERAALQAADEMMNDAYISDATWQKLAAELDYRQLMELMLAIGVYTMLSWFFNSIRITPEERNVAKAGGIPDWPPR